MKKKNKIENDRINNINNEKLDHTQINNSLFGIINIGLTCYINSVIQIILHTELFLEKFLEKSQIITKNKNSTSFYIYKILCNIFKNKNLKVIDIRDFIHFLKNFHPIFGGINQCDALEFLRVLLEDISTELNEVKKSKNHILLDNDNNKTKLTLCQEYKKNFLEKESSIISNNFYSQIISIYSCEFKHELYAFQYMMDFPLLIPENKYKLDLFELLEYNFASENIVFETKCSKCNKICIHSKKLKISQPPNILILSLQRFKKNSNVKNNCFVSFSENLNLSNFIDKDCGFEGDTNYILYAIINHTGTISSGHYYSYLKISNSKDYNWYEFNDDKVIELGHELNENPYLYSLFYLKK